MTIKINFKNKKTAFILEWTIVVFICMGAEWYAQTEWFVSGLGFILAILNLPLLNKDLEGLK